LCATERPAAAAGSCSVSHSPLVWGVDERAGFVLIRRRAVFKLACSSAGGRCSRRLLASSASRDVCWRLPAPAAVALFSSPGHLASRVGERVPPQLYCPLVAHCHLHGVEESDAVGDLPTCVSPTARLCALDTGSTTDSASSPTASAVSDGPLEEAFRNILLRRINDGGTTCCAICGISEGERSLDAGQINGTARFSNREDLAMMYAADLIDPLLPTNGVLLCHQFCHYVCDAFFLSVRVGDSAEEVVHVSEELQDASPAYKALHGQPLFQPPVAGRAPALWPTKVAWQAAEELYRTKREERRAMRDAGKTVSELPAHIREMAIRSSRISSADAAAGGAGKA